MYKQIKSHALILEYLKKNTYHALPMELWDRNLWLYGRLLDLLSIPFTGRSFDNITLYMNISAGIALVERNGGKINISIDASCGDGLIEFIDGFKNDDCDSIKINVCNQRTAKIVRHETGLECISGDIKFFTRECAFTPLYDINEVEPGEGYLFKNERQPDGWPEIDECINMGTKYFSINEDGLSASWCGLCYVTAHRSEIIAVNTRPEFRNKGYAKSVSAHALSAALRNVPVVTWTTDIYNAASRATAMSLGFKPYMESYGFNIDHK